MKTIKLAAGEPVSRILFLARCARFTSERFDPRKVAIIPLGLESLRDSSSLPEGSSVSLFRAGCIRAGPALPSYLALLHAGFSVPRMLPPGRWALTPPFHPCQMRSTESGEPLVFPRACRRSASSTGGLFSVALSVAAPLELPSVIPRPQPPGVTRRVALRRRLFRVHDDGVRTFLPSAALASSEPAITRLTRHGQL
jgi:hypothetical protein